MPSEVADKLGLYFMYGDARRVAFESSIDAAIRAACERQRESDRLHAMKLDIETVVFTNDVQRLAYNVKRDTVQECRDIVAGLLATAPLVCDTEQEP